jgi:hypothetical protein
MVFIDLVVSTLHSCHQNVEVHSEIEEAESLVLVAIAADELIFVLVNEPIGESMVKILTHVSDFG